MSNPTPAVPPISPGLLGNFRFDLLSGFLVFLIAMPLCLGIAKASEYPPIAGIWTAVIGGILTTFLSNSQLTIKGPAAGLIVVVAGSVASLGEHAIPSYTDAQRIEFVSQGKSPEEIKALEKARQFDQLKAGYPLVLGCALVAGVLQILFGLFKAGTLGELVPLTPVHGMLAAIGITIMAKQLFPMFGIPGTPATWPPIRTIFHVFGLTNSVADDKEIWDLFIHGSWKWDPMLDLGKINGKVALIGLTSLAILIVFPYLKAKVKALKSIPVQVIVLAIAIPMGILLNLGEVGKEIGVTTLVTVNNIIYSADPQAALAGAFTWPKFDAIATGPGVNVIIMFSLIASIESMLSSQAIDMLDPWRRKTNQNRDLLATGVGNTVCAAIGALPMISEIVRSKANIDNGGRTKAANMFHGLFLLAFVLLLPMLINIIPMAALGAMLVFVGFRLASPKEFIHTYKIGPEQLLVFVTTIVVTLSTDLLIGVLSGILLKLLIHVLNGAPLSSFVRATIEVANTDDDKTVVLKVRKAAVFANWLGFKKAILKEAATRTEIILDLSETRLVDHSTMEKIHQLETELESLGKHLKVTGLEGHRSMSDHPLAARKLAGKTPLATPKLPTTV